MAPLTSDDVVDALRRIVVTELRLTGTFTVRPDKFVFEGREYAQSIFDLASFPELKVKGFDFAAFIIMRGYAESTRPVAQWDQGFDHSEKACIIICDSRYSQLVRVTGNSQQDLFDKIRPYLIKNVAVVQTSSASWLEVVQRVVAQVEDAPVDSGDAGAAVSRALLLGLAKEILQVLKKP